MNDSTTPKQASAGASPKGPPPNGAATPGPAKLGSVDVEVFSRNLARMVEGGGKALAAYLRPREDGQIASGPSDEINDMVRTLGEVA